MQRTQRLKHRGHGRHLHRHSRICRLQPRTQCRGQRFYQSPVPHQPHRARHPHLLDQGMNVLGHTLEIATEEPVVGLALVREVRQLALGEDRAACGNRYGLAGRRCQRRRLFKGGTQPSTDPLHGLARPRRAAIVLLVVELPVA